MTICINMHFKYIQSFRYNFQDQILKLSLEKLTVISQMISYVSSCSLTIILILLLSLTTLSALYHVTSGLGLAEHLHFI